MAGRELVEGRRRRVGYRLAPPPPPPASPPTRGHEEATPCTTPSTLWLVEDPTLVLLGGEVWPSAFAMAELVEARLVNQQQQQQPLPGVIVELGAGAGLCGLVAAATILQMQQQQRPCHVFLTDESPELAAVNAGLFREAWRLLPAGTTVEVRPTRPPCVGVRMMVGDAICDHERLLLFCLLNPFTSSSSSSSSSSFSSSSSV
jgi:hypothetical protein